MNGGKLVTIREASRIIGVTNLSDLKAKYPGFPPPALQTTSVALWDLEAIRTWFYTRKLTRPRKTQQ